MDWMGEPRMGFEKKPKKGTESFAFFAYFEKYLKRKNS